MSTTKEQIITTEMMIEMNEKYSKWLKDKKENGTFNDEDQEKVYRIHNLMTSVINEEDEEEVLEMDEKTLEALVEALKAEGLNVEVVDR